ncbi:MAG: histidine phosphatase family protein [Cytophagales bacterium]|nr:histidine phosphatase family protein [Cytophagales bacterium]
MGAKCDSKIHSTSDAIPLRDGIAAIPKTLYIARHAKSSWTDPDLSDFERPLKKRGEKDAPMMGKILASKGVKPELIISSPAKRAITTAHILAKEIKYPIDKIVTNEEIYMASVSDLRDIIEQLNDSLKSVMLVGHNPGFTSLANYLTKHYFDNVPTTGVVAIGFDVSGWNKIKKNSGKVIFFEYPKKYKE